ncbi:MAG: hypothetical protein ACEQR8_10020 [Cypionkella sp.]
MKNFAPARALAPVLLLGALAACGDTDDASTAAEADTVEMPADEAMTGVEATPVADPNANATATATAAAAPEATEDATAEQAGEDAADVAARAQEAAATAEEATRTE